MCSAVTLLLPFLVAVAKLRKPKLHHDYMRKPMIFRVQCVLVLAALLVGGTPDWAAANHKMKQWLKQHNKGKA